MSDVSEIKSRLEDLESKVVALQQERDRFELQRDEYQRLYREMMERCRKLELGLLQSKSEHVAADSSQLALSVLGMVLDQRNQAELEDALAYADKKQDVRGHTRNKPTGRKPIPEELPRVEIEVVPPEVQRAGLDAFERIGEEVSETIERRPASLVVARVIRPKYVPKVRERDAEQTRVLIAEPPELPIPKGLAGPGMLADTIVKRWQDHTPLNRMEDIYGRDGLELARSTICGWHFELRGLIEPVVAAMRQDAFTQPYLCVDATGVLVQHPQRCRTGHFWVIVAPQRHVIFEYTPEHSGDAVDDVLAGYKGYLVADAHTVYDHLYKTGDVIEVNCWAHCRRYFFKCYGASLLRLAAA